MIGLVDYDWFYPASNQLLPNLEIMKLATYYKIEERKFCRLLSLNEEELDGYDKIYFFSELSSSPNIPSTFLRNKKIIYGGTAFTKKKYIPFENSIIDFTLGKPDIYKEFLKEKYYSGEKAKKIAHVLDDSYYRMCAGDNILPIPPVIPKKRFFIYDRELFIPQWPDILKEIVSRKPSTIIPIHPVYCNKLSNYFLLRNDKKISRNIEIILDLNIPLSETHYMFKQYLNLFLADISETSNVYILLGGSFQSQAQYYKDLIYKLNLLYLFWSKKIPIKIKYEKPDITCINPLDNMEKIIASWTTGITKNNKTLDEKFTSGINNKLKKIIKQERAKFLELFPHERALFKQNYTMLVKGGFWYI